MINSLFLGNDCDAEVGEEELSFLLLDMQDSTLVCFVHYYSIIFS